MFDKKDGLKETEIGCFSLVWILEPKIWCFWQIKCTVFKVCQHRLHQSVSHFPISPNYLVLERKKYFKWQEREGKLIVLSQLKFEKQNKKNKKANETHLPSSLSSTRVFPNWSPIIPFCKDSQTCFLVFSYFEPSFALKHPFKSHSSPTPFGIWE